MEGWLFGEAKVSAGRAQSFSERSNTCLQPVEDGYLAVDLGEIHAGVQQGAIEHHVEARPLLIVLSNSGQILNHLFLYGVSLQEFP